MRIKELFQLIKTMNSAEKRFVRQSAPTARSPKYLSLFDQLDAQEHFDLAKLQDALRDERMLGNLTAAANYLIDLLLKRLGEFHLQNRKNHAQNRRLEGIEFLYDRQIYSLVEKRIKKVWNEAQRLGDAGQEWECLKWVRRLKRRNPRYGSTELFLDQAETRVMAQLNSEYRLLRLHDQLFTLLRNFGKRLPNEKSSELERHIADLETLRHQPKSFDGQIAWHSAWAFVHEFQGEPNRTMQIADENLQFWYSYPDQILQKTRRFIGALINFFIMCHAQDNRSAFDTAVETARKRAHLPPEIQQDLDLRILNIELLFLLRSNDYPAALTLLGTEKNLLPRASVLPSLMFNITITYLGARNFSSTGKWINALLGLKKGKIRLDILDATRLLEIVVTIEKKQFELLPYKIRSIERYLRNSKTKWIKAFLKLAKEISKYPTRHRRAQLYQNFLDNIKDSPDQDKLGFAEIQLWAKHFSQP